MAENKLVKKTSGKKPRATSPSKKEAARPRSLAEKAKELETHILKVEMAILATSRQEQERKIKTRDMILPQDRAGARGKGEKPRLTSNQAAIKNRQLMVQIAEFAVTGIIFVGGCAWLYQWWARTQGGL